jgi:uncharacterized protein YceK
MLSRLVHQLPFLLFLAFFILLMSGCSSVISSTTSRLSDNLSRTILDSDDPQTVADGAPSYLLLLDSLILDSPDNKALLQSAANLYSAYAGVFVDEPARAARMSSRALNYAEQALCVDDPNWCEVRSFPFDKFSATVKKLDRQDISLWYSFGTAWAGWIQANSGNMAAVAQLPKVSLIMQRMIELDETWQHGGPHLYMGVFSTLLPPSLGGKPELGRQHFERAIEISKGQNLMAKVLYAEKYARLVFDQTLHDQLLHEVLSADPHAEGLTLMNTLAQQRADELLKSSVDYF